MRKHEMRRVIAQDGLNPADRLLTVLLDGADRLHKLAEELDPPHSFEVVAWVQRARYVMEDIYSENHLQAVRESR